MTDTAIRQYVKLGFALLAATIVCGCAQNETQPPGFSSSPAFSTCAGQLTEPACKERRGCRWINEHKREDGTFATARCAGGERQRKR